MYPPAHAAGDGKSSEMESEGSSDDESECGSDDWEGWESGEDGSTDKEGWLWPNVY